VSESRTPAMTTVPAWPATGSVETVIKARESLQRNSQSGMEYGWHPSLRNSEPGAAGNVARRGHQIAV
jgi:hypothetical protein